MNRHWLQSLMVLFLALTTPGRAADFVWTNTATGNWTTAANWSPNAVPGSLDSAFITNSGTYTVTVNTTVTVGSLTLGDPNATGIQMLANSGTLTVTNTHLETNAIILLNAGTLITAGPATLLGKINQAGGTWQLNVATAASSLNQTNGDVQGRNLTVTNWNWYAGNQYRGTPGNNAFDDRTIIPAGGTLNLLGTATRYFTYHSATGPSRTLDNHGTINWSGNALLYSYGTVNNYGSTIVSAVGSPHYLWPNAGPNPIWNNYGTFTRTAGTMFRFQGVYLNNSGTLDSQQGTLSLYSTVFNNHGPLTVANGMLQAFASSSTNHAGMTFDATSVFSMDNSGTFVFQTNASLTVPGYDKFILNAGEVYLRTTNITAPSVWVAGAGLYFQTNNVFPAINMSLGGIQLEVPVTLGQLNQTNGNVQGRNLTVTNWNWLAGYHYRGMPGNNSFDDRTIIPAGGTMNLLGTATRYFSYYSASGPSRTLDNYGTINWSGNALFYSYGTVNNYGSTIVSAVGSPHYLWPNAGPNPIWNNYGTFTRTAGTMFRFQGVYLNNSGTLDSQQGTLSLYSTVFNNHGPLTVANGMLQAFASSSTNHAGMTFDATSVFSMENSGTFVFQTNASLTVPGYDKFILNAGEVYLRTTNITAPSAWVAGAGLYFQTNNVFPAINMSLGGIQLEVPVTLGQLNQTNGNIQGRNLTVTNWNWFAGYHYRGTPGNNSFDDRTIIPAGGTMNLLGTATRYFTYYSATGPSRTLDNFGTVNWSGNALLYSYGLFNNHGTVNVTAVGTPQYIVASASVPPTFNNYGTFNRTNGTVFHFNGSYVNNHGIMNARAGILSSYGSTFTNYNLVNVSAGAVFQTEAGGVATFAPPGQVIAPTMDSIRLGAAAAYLQSTNILSPSLWLQAGTIYQQTNIAVAQLNLSGANLELAVPATLHQLNQTNGLVQGRTLTVTNWNWFAGHHYRGVPGLNDQDDRTIIPPGGTLNLLGPDTRNLTYYSATGPSRTLDNFGMVNWSGNALLYSYGLFNNHGTVNVTAVGTPQYIVASASVPPTFNNYGTFNRTNGTVFHFNGSYVNNHGIMNARAGILSSYGSTFTNYNLVNVNAGAVFQTEAGGSITFAPASTVIAPTLDSIRLGAALAYVQSTNIQSPSVWLQAGTVYQQTNIAVPRIDMSGANLELAVPATLHQLNQTNGLVQGRTLTVTNWNWLAGHHYRGVPGLNDQDDRTIIPPGGTLNLIGPDNRNLTYYTATGPGRTLDNYGTVNWTGPLLLTSYGSFNNHGSVNVSAVGAPQYYGPGGAYPSVWNNYGTFTRSAGTLFYFQGGYVNNPGLMEVQQGALSVYGSTFTNTTGRLNVGPNGVFQSEAGGVVAFKSGSQVIAVAADSVRLGGAVSYVETTNLITPALWQQAGTLYQRTNIAVAKLNMSGGALQLDVPAALNQLNQTNGDVQGRTLTVTNWNWLAGHHYRGVPGLNDQDDRTIIPPGGTANLLGTASRNLTYFNNGPGRTLDNHGAINWSGAMLLTSYGQFNNHGSVNVSAVGAPQYYSPSSAVPSFWNNHGTFTRSAGTLFYFQGGYLNNFGLMEVQQGTLSIYNSTFTNLAGGAVSMTGSGLLLNEAGSTTTLNPSSSLAASGPNAFQIPSGSVYARSIDLALPSLLISGGTLYQETNVVVPVINESAGTWQLNLPATATTYNLTNGDLRGANLTLNNFNWLGGILYATSAASNTVTITSTLNIAGNNAKTLGYLTVPPGRNLINHGAATWGGVNITGQGGATLLNHGTLTVTNDPALVWGGGGATPTLVNLGTFTKAAGTGTATYSSTAITNGGTFNYNSGSLSIGGNFVQTNGSAFLGTNFTASSNLRVEAGTLTGKGGVAGYFYNNGTVNPGASPGLITGTTFTNTAAATYNCELGGLVAGTGHDQIRLTGASSIDGMLNVSLANNYAPVLSNRFIVVTTSARTGIFASVIPPPGITFNTIYSTTNVILEIVGLTNAPLQILTNLVNQTVWTPDPATFAVTVSGVTPISFQWQFNGTNISGATNTAYTIPAVATTDTGLYTVNITDGNGGTTNTSATLTVIPFAGTIYWTNTLGGTWSTPANWLPNRVPGPTNTAAIFTNGTYTVSINTDAAVSNLLVGLPLNAGTQTVHLVSGSTLALGGNSNFETNTTFALNGLLQTAGGSNYLGGRLDWQLGTLSGAGRTVIGTNAILTFYGSLNQKNIATNILENHGTFTYGNDSFGNAQALRFAGGAQLTNHASGVINIGTAAYTYAGSQTPRSHLVNYGTVATFSTGIFSPSYVSLDFINHGLLDNYGYVYLARGTNYGTFHEYNGLTEISIFGDPVTGEAFSFEPGTQITGPLPHIACGGPVQWRAGHAVHGGRLFVAAGSGGASYPNAEFKVLANYTNTYQVVISRGAFTVADPGLITDLRSFSDGIYNGFHTFAITNAGTMHADNLSHTIYGFGNSGRIFIRTNASFSGGSFFGAGGEISITNTATATFGGSSFDAQLIRNFGSATVTGNGWMTGDTRYENRVNATTYFGGGAFLSGPASAVNDGLMSGFGGIYFPTTNRATVLADDPIARTLTMGSYVQTSGLTDIGPGRMGGNLDIQGGLITGDTEIAGSLRNSSAFVPGQPFNSISITGNYTNTPAGLETFLIKGANLAGYPQVRVGGTSYLSGTLSVLFTNGFTPAPGNFFTAMVFTARSGVFDQIINDTYGLEAIYSPSNLVLRAENLLPNVTLSVIGGSTQWVCTPFRIFATGSDPDGVVTNMALYLNNTLIGSSPGSSITTTVETDFPGTNIFEARATDNRNGTRGTNQAVGMVTAPLHVLSLGGVRTNAFKICMLGQEGSNYMMLAATNLATPLAAWLPLGLMENTNGIWRYLDPGTVTNRPMRYYRARLLP